MSRADQAEQRKATRLRFIPAALGVGLAIAMVAACGAGQISQTAREVAAVNGASGEVGPIDIEDARLAYPPSGDGVYRQGSSAPILLAIINHGSTSDRLVSVTSPLAGSATTVSGQLELLPGTAVYSDATTQLAVSLSARPSSPPSATESLTSSPSNTSQNPSATVRFDTISIVLTNLTKDVRAGVDVPVTFLFRDAGEVTLHLPIDNPPLTRSSSATSSSATSASR